MGNKLSNLCLKNEEAILYSSIVIVPCLEIVWEMYLHIRQIRICKTEQPVPVEMKRVLNEEIMEESRFYLLEVLQCNIAFYLYKLAILILIFKTKTIHNCWRQSLSIITTIGFHPRNEWAASITFIFLYQLFKTIVLLPLKIYKTQIEQRYGFNSHSFNYFFKGQLKYFMWVFMVGVLPTDFILIYIARNKGEYFYLWAWAVFVFLSVPINILLNNYIVPLMDDLQPFPQGSLRTSIEDLAAEHDFPIDGLYYTDASTRSSHSNAYFIGLCGKYRIVLYDTIIYRIDPHTGREIGLKRKEILAVLLHEIGHWKMNHVVKAIVVVQLVFLIRCLAYGFFLTYPVLYKVLGFPAGVQPIIVGYTAVDFIMEPYDAVLRFFTNIISRKHEANADQFVAQYDYGIYLRKAICKLGKDNLQYPICDWLFSGWYLSHPTILERSRMLATSLNIPDSLPG